MSGLYDLKLTADEVLLLDGRCRPDIQAHVDSARLASSLTAVSPGLAKMIVAVIDTAKRDGRLIWQRTNISHCDACDRRDGYWTVRRTTRYKVKGRPDYDSPKTFGGYECRRAFISIKNSIWVGFCETCAPEALPILQPLLQGLRAEIPEPLLGRPSDWTWQENRECTKCGWIGHEGMMKRAPTIMGHGTYPAYCPECGAGGAFSNTVKITDGFTLSPTTPEGKEAGL